METPPGMEVDVDFDVDDVDVDNGNGSSARDSDIDASVRNLYELSQQPPKVRGDVAFALGNVVSYAQRYGLSDTSIQTMIVAMLGRSRLDNATSNALFSSLLPAGKVSSSVVYAIVSRLGPGSARASPTVQAQALRWLILVSDLFEESKAISRVYGILFNLLDMTPLRDGLCHLLCLFTEPRHVQSYRAKLLRGLRKSPNSNEYVTALLSYFHAIRPDLIPEEECAGKVASLESPDPLWRNRLESIQHGPVLTGLGRRAESQFRVAQRSIGKHRRGRHLVETDNDQGGEGLEDVTGVKDFVAKLPNIVRPSDMEAVLDDPLLQHYMATAPDDIVDLDAEVDEILRAMFSREEAAMAEGQPLSSKTIQVLRKVLEYGQFQKFLPDSVENFIFKALKQESNHQHMSLLLELLTWRYPGSHSWKDSILSEDIEQHILRGSQGSPEILLDYYVAVLRNRTATFLSGSSSFGGTPSDSATKLADHCSYIALSALARSQSLTTRSSVLAYLGTLAEMSTFARIDNAMPIFNIDGPAVYLLLFAQPSVDSLSALLSLLADYKKVFEEIVAQHAGKASPSKYPPDFIKRLNGCLMDCCNLFWRSRAFSTKTEDKNAAGCMIREATSSELARYVQMLSTEYTLSGSFSLTCHPALVGLAAAAWVELEADRLGISEEDLLAKRREYRDKEEEEAVADGMDVDGEEAEKPMDGDAGANGDVNNNTNTSKTTKTTKTSKTSKTTTTTTTTNGNEAIRAIHFGPVSRLSLQRLEAAGGTSVSWSQYRLAVLDWLDLRGGDGISKLMKRTMKLLMDKPAGAANQLTPVASPGVRVGGDTPMVNG